MDWKVSMAKQVTTYWNYVSEFCFLPNQNVANPRPLELMLGLCKVGPGGDFEASSSWLKVIGFAYVGFALHMSRKYAKASLGKILHNLMLRRSSTLWTLMNQL